MLTGHIGSVAMNVKGQIPNVTVSATFRGLTEYNGRTLAFINVTEDLWAGGKQLILYS